MTDPEPREPFSYWPNSGASEQPAPEPPAAEAPNKPRRRWLLIAAAVIVVLGAVAIAVAYRYGGLGTSPLVAAQEKCDPDAKGTRVADNDKTLIIDMAGEEDKSGVPVETEACILRELKVTSAVAAHLDSTRALDGRQTDSWGDYTAAWTYHPDAGLDMIIQRK